MPGEKTDPKGRTLALVAEIDGDELALVIAEACIGIKRPLGRSAASCLAELAAKDPVIVAGFRKAAHRGLEYVTACISRGSRPS